MEDIKLWELNGTQTKLLGSNNRLESEQLLEDALVENPDLLIEDLTLIGRQTPTEGGPLDLLGVDGDGKLVVFELKRGTLSRDAVAQIIDYASDLDSMDPAALAVTYPTVRVSTALKRSRTLRSGTTTVLASWNR